METLTRVGLLNLERRQIKRNMIKLYRIMNGLEKVDQEL